MPAGEKRGAERRLKLPDGGADGRLRDVELPRSSRERAEPRSGLENGEMMGRMEQAMKAGHGWAFRCDGAL